MMIISLETNLFLKKPFRKVIIFSLLIIYTLSPQHTIYGQQDSDLPIYVVQSGDTLYSIASTFGITVTDLLSVNEISDPNSISLGTELFIPGLEGINGKLDTPTILIGENLNNLTIKYGLTLDQLIKLNRITSRNEIVAGISLIAPEIDTETAPGFSTFRHDETVVDIAIKNNSNPWSYMLKTPNRISSELVPGDLFDVSTTEGQSSTISPLINNIQIEPLPLEEGKTTQVVVHASQPINIYGGLSEYNLRFVNSGENEYTALQGVYAEETDSVYELKLISDDLNGGSSYEFSQNILVSQVYYGLEQDLLVDANTIDPNITVPEEELVNNITSNFTPEKYWAGKFAYPLDYPETAECITATFGIPRSYNGGSYQSFHTGVDFLGCVNNNIYAAASGVIAYIGPLTVRGNATIIDHGLGIYTGYWHQSEILVETGQFVEAGQQIGVIGNTGRSSGAHLHFEVWVNGVQVNPFDWLENSYL